MKTMLCGATVIVLLLVAGCSPSGETDKVRKYVNIEITGTPECLGEIVASVADRGIGVPVMPKWSGGIGSMEIGPVEARQYSDVVKKLELHTCIKAVRLRPCATPNSDLKIC